MNMRANLKTVRLAMKTAGVQLPANLFPGRTQNRQINFTARAERAERL